MVAATVGLRKLEVARQPDTERHHDDLLRELGQLVLQRLMDAEAEQRCGAGRHERSEDSVNQRNGYRERTLVTRLGTMELRIPKLRTGSYLPSFIEPRKASEQALVAVVQEAYVKAISTRKVDEAGAGYGHELAPTNSLERLNKEIKRRSRVVGIFPNNAAIMPLVGTLLAEQADEWQVTRRHMSQETLARVLSKEDQANPLPQSKAA